VAAKLAVVASGVLLTASVLAAATWWILLVRREIPADWKVWLFLIGVAGVQIGSWAVLFRLLVRVRRNLAWSLAVLVLCMASVCSNVVNGLFTPAIGGILGMMVLLFGMVGLVVTRRLTTFCS